MNKFRVPIGKTRLMLERLIFAIGGHNGILSARAPLYGSYRQCLEGSHLGIGFVILIVLIFLILGCFNAPVYADTDRQSDMVSGGFITLVQIVNKTKKQVEMENSKLTAINHKTNTATQELVAPLLNSITPAVRFADSELQRAKTIQDPDTREVYMKSAMEKLDYARAIIQRVRSIELPTESQENGVAPHGGGGSSKLCAEGCSALQQLRELDALDISKGGSVAANNVIDGENYDRSKNIVLIQSQGEFTNINVEPLARAMANSGAPVFQSVTTPDGKVRLQLSPQALKLSQDVLHDRAKVGGVALAVTVDALAFSGVSGLRLNGLESDIKYPVIISLKRLENEATHYLHSAADWTELPQALRFPGDIDRLYGIVLDEKHGDVFLVGSKARNSDDRIELDSLIVGARSVWRDGNIPMVSLDMNPADPGGPQTVRVIGVPLQSRFVKIMLDADYAMKKIIFSKLEIGDPQFNRINMAMGTQQICRRGAADTISRYWLTPVPLKAGDIHLSPTGRTLLFSTAIRDETEAMRAAGTTLVGTGEQSGFAVQLAGLFTRDYPQLENSSLIRPHDIYNELHGLVDIVTVYSLLRQEGIQSPVLDALASLPLPKLSGADAVPASYPGITNQFVVKCYVQNEGELKGTLVIQGGVLMRDRSAGVDTYNQYGDIATLDLEHAVDTFPPGVVSIALDEDFSVPQSSAFVGNQAEQLVSNGEELMAVGHLASAQKMFQQAIALDPFMGAAWADLALADLHSGDTGSAWIAAQRALLLNPGDEGIRTAALETVVAVHPEEYFPQKWDVPTRRAAFQDYVDSAIVAYEHGILKLAHDDASDALRIWPGEPSAYFVRSLTYINLNGQNAEQDRALAIDGFRQEIDEHPSASRKRNLARALAMEAGLKIEKIMPIVALLNETKQDVMTMNISEITSLITQEQAATQIADDAVAADPDVPSGEIFKMEAMFATKLTQLLLFHTQVNFDSVSAMAGTLVDRFPGNADVFGALSLIYGMIGRKDLAVAELTNALQLDPENTHYLTTRASLNADLGNCVAALADVANLTQLLNPHLNKVSTKRAGQLSEYIKKTVIAQCH